MPYESDFTRQVLNKKKTTTTNTQQNTKTYSSDYTNRVLNKQQPQTTVTQPTINKTQTNTQTTPPAIQTPTPTPTPVTKPAIDPTPTPTENKKTAIKQPEDEKKSKYLANSAYLNSLEKGKVDMYQKALENRSDTNLGDIVNGLVDFGKKTIGTVADVGANVTHGFLTGLEGLADTAQYGVADIADFFGQKDIAQGIRNNASFNSTGALFGTNNVNENLTNFNVLDKLDDYSYAPEIIDDISQGIGNTLYYAASSAVTGGGALASNANIFASSYGNAMSNALKDGASIEDARKTALISGAVETISENFFDSQFGIKSFSGISDVVQNGTEKAVKKFFGSKAGKVASSVIGNMGEGFEEVLSNFLTDFTNNIAYRFDNSYQYGRENYDENKNPFQAGLDAVFNEDTLYSFISASLSSAITNYGGGFIQNKALKNKMISAYAQDNKITFEQAKQQLENTQQQTQIEQPLQQAETPQIEQQEQAPINEQETLETQPSEPVVEPQVQQEMEQQPTQQTQQLIPQNEQIQPNLEEQETTENNNLAEKVDDNVIKLDNNLKSTKDTPANTKLEQTGVRVGNKPVEIEVPLDSHKNNLGQNIPNKIDTAKVKNGDGDSRFYETITQRSQFVNQEVKDRASQDDFIKHYDKITNEETLDNALKDLSTRGTEAIAEFFENKELTPKDTAMGIVLFEQAQNAGDYDMANRVLRKMRENGTTVAQTLQLYSVMSRMTPEGMYKYAGDQLLRAQEIFEENKSKKWIEGNRQRWILTPDEVEFIKTQMAKIQELNKSKEPTAEVSLEQFSDRQDNKTEAKETENATTKEKIESIKVPKLKLQEEKLIVRKSHSKKTGTVTVELDRAKQLELAKIQKMIEDKLPATKGQALKAWMRISMLGNPKTIGTRNPLGNFFVKPVNAVGDFLGSVVDRAIAKKTGVRTKGNFNLSAEFSGFKKGSSEAVQDYKVGVNTRDISADRFEIGSGKAFNEKHTGILSKQRNAVSKILNESDRGISFVLDLGDRPFYEASFQESLQNQMKLNNIEDITKAPQWMIDNAQQEALERTWGDDNGYTKAVLDIRKALNGLNVKGYGLGDVLIPFAKTPANLTKAIVDYSPAGFVSAITKGKNLRNAIENGKFTPQMQHTFVNQLGKATAGTILYAIAYGLAKAGLTTGALDDDKDVADFMRYTLGIQPYSIKIGNMSFTYDWAQPVAAPFAIMADLQKELDKKDGSVDLGFIIKSAFNTSSSILMEQSFLQGISEVFNGYGEPLDNLLTQIEGLPARAVPTFLQQIATLIDGKQRMTYGMDGIDSITAQVQSKIPGVSEDLPVRRNTLGKEVERYGGENNIFNVFINPANYSQGNPTKSAEEIYRVYQETNDKTIFPRTVSNSLKNEDGTKLTNQQKSDFLKVSGSIVDDEVEKLLNDSTYKKMNEEDKAATIKYIVDYSYNKAREKVTGHELSSTYKNVDKALSSDYALYEYAVNKVSGKVKEDTKTTETQEEKNRYAELERKGISRSTFDQFKYFVSNVKADKDANGKTISGSKKQKIIDWIQSQPLTAQQKQNLYQDYLDNQGLFSYYK